MKIFLYPFFFFCLFTNKASHAQSPVKITVSVCIIGNSKLHIKGGEMYWENLEEVLPGESAGCLGNTTVNGKRWIGWKSRFKLDFNTDSFSITGTVLEKNDISVLVQSPTAENGWETIWWFNDPSDFPHQYSVLFELIPPAKNKKAIASKEKTPDKNTVIQKLIPNNITFEIGNANLTKQSLEELDKIYESLKLSNKTIEICGHTNDVGEKEKLLKLSEERAKAVYAYLLKKGLDKGQMAYRGYGDTEPIASNKTEEGKAKNRRVEIKIIN